LRAFLLQVEGVETAIWLCEVGTSFRNTGSRLSTPHLAANKDAKSGGLMRDSLTLRPEAG